MRRLTVGAAILGVCLGLAGAVRGDNAKEDPKKTLDEALKGSLGAAGYHFHLTFNTAVIPQFGSMDGTGACKKPDLLQMTESRLGDVVMRGKKAMVKAADKNEWQEPEKALAPMMGPAAPFAGVIFNVLPTPNDVLNDLRGFVASAQAKPDDNVDGVDCKVVELPATPDQTKGYVKNLIGKLGPMGATIGLRAEAVDYKTAKLTHTVWIGKEDKKVHKVIQAAELPMSKQGGAAARSPLAALGAASLDTHTEVTYTDYDKDLDLKFDDVVKQKLGIK